MLKGTTKTLWEKKLNKIFQEREPSEVETLINLVSMSIYSRNSEDLGSLYHVLGNDIENFSKVISLFSGRTISFPSQEEFRSALLIAICYYYREIKGYSWKEVNKELPFQEDEINSVKLGKGISKMKKDIQSELFNLLGGDDVSD